MTHETEKRGTWKLAARLGVALVALGAAIGIAACGGTASGAGKISLVAYSTPQQVYEDKLEPAFQKTDQGNGVDFSNSFGASGDQSRAVEAGQPADVVGSRSSPT